MQCNVLRTLSFSILSRRLSLPGARGQGGFLLRPLHLPRLERSQPHRNPGQVNQKYFLFGSSMGGLRVNLTEILHLIPIYPGWYIDDWQLHKGSIHVSTLYPPDLISWSALIQTSAPLFWKIFFGPIFLTTFSFQKFCQSDSLDSLRTCLRFKNIGDLRLESVQFESHYSGQQRLDLHMEHVTRWIKVFYYFF